MEESLIKKGEDICETMDHLIVEDNKFIIDKALLYCKYCLRLNKDYVSNSVGSNFYKECEDYLKELESWLNKSNIDMRNMRLKEKIDLKNKILLNIEPID